MIIDKPGGEILFRIVVWGPTGSGKTTSLRHLHQRASGGAEPDMLDGMFFTLSLGAVGPYQTSFALVEVIDGVSTGAKLLKLKGADVVILVVDSRANAMEANVASLAALQQNLSELGLHDVPIVFQYNQRDHEDCLPVDELDARLNLHGGPSVESIATMGVGVMDTMKAAARIALEQLRGAGSVALSGASILTRDARSVDHGAVGVPRSKPHPRRQEQVLPVPPTDSRTEGRRC